MADLYSQPEGSVAGTVQSVEAVSGTQPGHHTKKLICGQKVPESPEDPFELCNTCRGKMVCWIVQTFLYPDKNTVRVFWPVANSSSQEAHNYKWALVKKPLGETDLLLSSQTWGTHYWPRRLGRAPWAVIGMSAKPALKPYYEGYGRTILEEIIGLGGRRLLAVMRATADRAEPLVENIQSELSDQMDLKGPAGDWLKDPASAWDWYDSIPFTPESPPVPYHLNPGYTLVSGMAPLSVAPGQHQLPPSASPSSSAAMGHAPPPATADPRNPAENPLSQSSGRAPHTSMIPQPLQPASRQQPSPRQPGLAGSLYSGGPQHTQSPHQRDTQASVAPKGHTHGTTASTSIPQPGSRPPSDAHYVHPAHVAESIPPSPTPAPQQQPQAPLASGEHIHPASPPSTVPAAQPPSSAPANYNPHPSHVQSRPPPEQHGQGPPFETSCSMTTPAPSQSPAAPPSSNLGQVQHHPGAQPASMAQQQQQQQQYEPHTQHQQQQHQQQQQQPGLEQQMAPPTHPPASSTAQLNPQAVAGAVAAEPPLPEQTMPDPISVEVNEYRTELLKLKTQLEEDILTKMEEEYIRIAIDKVLAKLENVQARGGR